MAGFASLATRAAVAVVVLRVDAFIQAQGLTEWARRSSVLPSVTVGRSVFARAVVSHVSDVTVESRVILPVDATIVTAIGVGDRVAIVTIRAAVVSSVAPPIDGNVAIGVEHGCAVR
jgi:hypothetical protein